jgi:hypothetical protein
MSCLLANKSYILFIENTVLNINRKKLAKKKSEELFFPLKFGPKCT